MWPGVQTAAIKLGRSKGLPLNTHTILYTALFISLSPYPLSPKPSTRAIAWPLIFSRCWVPPFLPFSTLFLTGRLKNKGCAAILPLLSLPALPLPQQFQHISSQTWEAGAPPEQKCFSRTCWCCCCNQLFRQWCIFVTAAVCDMCAFFLLLSFDINHVFLWAEWCWQYLSLVSFAPSLPVMGTSWKNWTKGGWGWGGVDH